MRFRSSASTIPSTRALLLRKRAASRSGQPRTAGARRAAGPEPTWLASMLNRNYIQGKMTKTVVWGLLTSYYDSCPWPDCGIIHASYPWSGYYYVHPALWATAHTTQFAQPGWKYLDGDACGLFPGWKLCDSQVNQWQGLQRNRRKPSMQSSRRL